MGEPASRPALRDARVAMRAASNEGGCAVARCLIPVYDGWMTQVKPGGRRKPASKRRDCIVPIRMTEEERSSLFEAARARGLSFSSWCRSTMIEKAKEEAHDG